MISSVSKSGSGILDNTTACLTVDLRGTDTTVPTLISLLEAYVSWGALDLSNDTW